MPDSSLGRHARRNAARREIGRVAVELFLARGFQQTTIDDIAAAANVSRRTYFRYFATKDEALFAWVDDVGSDLADVLVSRPQDEPAFVSLRAALDVLVGYAEHDIGRIRTLKELAGPSGLFPALGNAKQGSWSSDLAAILATRAGAADSAEAALQVNVAFSAFDWAMSRWLAGPQRAPLGDLVEQALAAIQSGFE